MAGTTIPDKKNFTAGARRRSWLPARQRTGTGRTARRIRRGGVVALLAAMVGWLGLLLWQPFRHPQVHMACLSAGDYRVLRAPPIAFADEDIAAFVPLEDALYTAGSSAGPVLLDHLGSRAQMQTLGVDLENLLVGDSDVLILYISAHGVAQGGVPYLLCHDFDPASDAAGRFRVADLLAQLRASSASTKLLILDAGRIAHDPRLGLLANSFPRLLRVEVERLNDPALWVLGSNWVWERSHVSNALARSVFGYFVALGLQGGADLDGDWSVDLDELDRFVSANVGQWVREVTGGRETQTPVLHWGGGAWRPEDLNPPLMSIARLSSEPLVANLAEAVRQARVDSRSRSFRNLTLAPAPDQARWQRFTPTAQANLWRVNQRSRALSEFKDQQVGSLTSNVRTSTGDARAQPQSALQDVVGGQIPPSPAADAQDATNAPATDETPAPPPETAEAARPADAPAAADESAPLTAPQLIARGWQLRDRLEGRTGRRGSPVDYAPVEWRGFQVWLEQTEQLYLAGRIGDAERIAGRLRSTLATLENLPDAPPAAGSRPGAAQRMAAQFDRESSSLVAPHSLAMAALLARHGGPALSDGAIAAASALEQFATSGSGEEFVEWIAKLDPALDQYDEIRFARQLAELYDVPWADVQFALATHLLGEQLAASDPWCLPWVGDRLLESDRLRLAGERELTDRIGRQHVQRAVAQLRAAYDAYRGAAADAALIDEATSAARDLLQRAPHYVHWHATAGRPADDPAPQSQELTGLLETLLELNVALETPSPDGLSRVRGLLDGLLRWRQLVERGLQPEFVDALSRPPPAAGDAWRVQVLLDTPLPGAATRLKLLGIANGIDGLMASSYEMAKVPPRARSARPPTLEDWQLMRRRAELDLHLARLALPDGVAGAAEFTAIEEALAALVAAEAHSGDDDQTAWDALTAGSDALEDFYRALPGIVESTVQDNRDLSNPETRPQRLARLHFAERAWRMIDGRDAAAAGNLNPRALLFDAELYDLLIWQAGRYQLARADSSPAEALSHEAAARDSLTAARRIQRQPAIDAMSRPVIRFSGPTSISLTAAPEQTIEMEMQLLGVAEANAWLQLRYDPELLDVETPRGATIYRPTTPSGDEAYPYNPQLLDRPPSLVMRAGRSETIRMIVRRLENSAPPARIVLQAVTAATSARHETDVELPSPDALRVVVRGTPGSWAPSQAGVLLHPFPNQPTDYQFLLANERFQDTTLDVELIAAAHRPDPPLPTAAVSADDAARLLDRCGPWHSIARADGMLVPAGGIAVPIPFPPPPDGGEEPAAESAGDAAAAPDRPPPPRIDAGLLLVTTDKRTDRRTLRWIDLEPQRPRRYVLPRVAYDPDQQRLLIRVAPHNTALVPPGGVRVRAMIVGGLPQGSEARLQGEIREPRFEADLFADLPSGADRSAIVHLWVDDYPRAFIYRVDCDRHARDIPELSDLLAIRVLAPPEGAAFKAPAGPIPITFQVDAPPGSFEGGRGMVEVGVDPDRDRDFRGEPTVRLSNDRQAVAWIEATGPEGHVAIHTAISDFHLDLPAPDVQNAWVGVQGRVTAEGRTAWSSPIGIVLDGAPPEVLIEQVHRQPAGVVEIGTPLVVNVPATDHGLCGVAKVEAAIDMAGTGEFGPASPPVPARPAEDGRWSATLDTAPLVSGVYRVLLRATDNVGNEGRYASIPVEILSAEDAAARRASMTNEFRGTVLWGTRPIRQAELTLTSPTLPGDLKTTADDEGRFLFTDVPPGAYRLSIQGLATGVNRSKELDVTIDPAPARIPPLTIRVDKRDPPPAP